MKKSFSNVNLSFYEIDDTRGDEYDDDEFGTANSLKLLKDKIISDCMIVSCDLLTNVNIQSMANFYRTNNASFVALLADVVEQNSELPVPGSKGKFAPGSFYIISKCGHLTTLIHLTTFIIYF